MDIGALINNQYKVIEHIGRGGMADVWSARDQRLRRMVAIKTIAAGLSQDVDPVTLFEKEAQTIAQMEHPHILPIYDFGEYDNTLYIVMRYVTGGSLEGELQGGPMDMVDVLRLADNIGKALDYAHSQNVIHLDLKPPNILLDSGSSPYLADFGLATVLDKQGRARNPGSGTLLYMAPEQLTSDTIDHRADIYAFSIMIFHMLTGQLPFEGRSPLAMRQIQAGDTLPYIDEINEKVPHEFNEVLRRGTETDPYNRYSTHSELMEALHAIVQPTGAGVSTGASYQDELEPYQLETQQIESDDSVLLEAIDLYGRARYSWQGGQGRFLLGVTHFMLMSGYYQEADFHGLLIDREGYQMLLRGAIEYDHELEYWWNQVNTVDRRWVCLHALRSGNAPARIRALYRLETLPDDANNPVIPRLVAQALEIEVDTRAQLAALQVLGTRAKLIKRPSFSIKTEYRGRLLTSLTRFGIQVNEDAQWQEAVYSTEVDTLIAEQAFDENHEVAEFAARTIGKMRSLAGVAHLSEAQINGRPGALDALAFVRDEAPALPDIVSRQARFYAWMTNTFLRLTDNPLEGILRFAFALLGGWIAMGEQVYSLFRGQQLFSAQRWANTIAVGLVFGLFIAITYLVTDEMSRRLRGFWLWWQRIFFFGFLGFLMGTLSFGGFTWLFYQYTPTWDMMRFGGMFLAFALILSGILELRGWQAVILTTIMSFMPILIAHNAFYFQQANVDVLASLDVGVIFQQSTIILFAPLALIIGLFAGWRTSELSPANLRRPLPDNNLITGSIAVVVGAVWASVIWIYFMGVHREILAGINISWDSISLLFLSVTLFGIIFAYWLAKPFRIAMLALTAIGVFAAIFVVQGWAFVNYSFSVPVSALEPTAEMVYLTGKALRPIAEQPIFHFDNTSHVFSVTLPMVFVIALGVNLQPLLAGWWNWIGGHYGDKRRGEWLTSMLSYTLVLTALSSVLALFSAKQSVVWAMGWSAWAFITFVFALATFRWAKWGADGLIASAVVFVFGGFLFDAVNIRYQSSLGGTPELLRAFEINLPFTDFTPVLTAYVFWGLWSVIIGIFAWGALNRRLWSGIGLVSMLLGWYLVALFTPVQGSMSVFAMTHAALLLFTLAPRYEQMEVGRFNPPRFVVSTVETEKSKHDDLLTQAVPPPNFDEMPFRVSRQMNHDAPELKPIVDYDTQIVTDDVDELNKLLAQSDVNAANIEMDTVQFDENVDVDELNKLLAQSDVNAAKLDLETAIIDGNVDVDELNKLLAQSDVNAAKLDLETAIIEGNVDVDELNKLLAQSDVNAAKFDTDTVQIEGNVDVDELNKLLAQSDVNAAKFDTSDSQVQTELRFNKDSHQTDEVDVYIEDPNILDTEPEPGRHRWSDDDELATDNLPEIDLDDDE